MRQHTPLQQFKEAKQIASDYGMYIVEKTGRFLLFRKAERPIYLGARSSASTLRALVTRCAAIK